MSGSTVWEPCDDNHLCPGAPLVAALRRGCGLWGCGGINFEGVRDMNSLLDALILAVLIIALSVVTSEHEKLFTYMGF
jgi:hypothetical protein